MSTNNANDDQISLDSTRMRNLMTCCYWSNWWKYLLRTTRTNRIILLWDDELEKAWKQWLVHSFWKKDQHDWYNENVLREWPAVRLNCSNTRWSGDCRHFSLLHWYHLFNNRSSNETKIRRRNKPFWRRCSSSRVNRHEPSGDFFIGDFGVGQDCCICDPLWQSKETHPFT